MEKARETIHLKKRVREENYLLSTSEWSLKERNGVNTFYSSSTTKLLLFKILLVVKIYRREPE